MTKIRNISLFVLVFTMLIFSCASSPSIPMAKQIELASEDGRMVAYTFHITLEVKNVEETKSIIIEKCKTLNGFMTQERNDYLLLRIPRTEYKEFLSALESNGKILEKDIHGEDITDIYEDIVLQLESKLALRDKYTKLLEKAISVQDVLAIEKELERINVDIQRLEGRKLESEKRVEYITFNISLKKKVIPGPLGIIFYALYKVIVWLFVLE